MQKTTLMVAVESGELEVVKNLVSDGANMELQNEANYTALEIAIINNNTKMVELLCTLGANVNHIGQIGTTRNCEISVLMLAIEESHMDIVRTLIAYGANVNYIDEKGRTLYEVAIDTHYIFMISFEKTLEMIRYFREIGVPMQTKFHPVLYAVLFETEYRYMKPELKLIQEIAEYTSIFDTVSENSKFTLNDWILSDALVSFYERPDEIHFQVDKPTPENVKQYLKKCKNLIASTQFENIRNEMKKTIYQVSMISKRLNVDIPDDILLKISQIHLPNEISTKIASEMQAKKYKN